jgi:Calcium binding
VARASGTAANLDGSRETKFDPIKESPAMYSATMNDVPGAWPETWITVQPQPDRERQKRILKALGLPASQNLRENGQNSHVNEESLIRYYDYLQSHLSVPFVAVYPRPTSPAQAAIDRCEVIELLDPRSDPCDEFDGIYCRTRKGRFLVNLPLAELVLTPPSKNLEMLSDYQYWFWHWRD